MEGGGKSLHGDPGSELHSFRERKGERNGVEIIEGRRNKTTTTSYQYKTASESKNVEHKLR